MSWAYWGIVIGVAVLWGLCLSTTCFMYRRPGSGERHSLLHGHSLLHWMRKHSHRAA